MPLEALHAIDAGEAWLGERAVGADDELGAHRVTPIGRDVPSLGIAVPQRFDDRGLKHGEVVQVVLLRDRLAVGENLRPLGVVPCRDVVHLVEQRQVVVRNNIAGNTGVTVPVPGAADVGATFDDADALDALLAQAC